MKLEDLLKTKKDMLEKIPEKILLDLWNDIVEKKADVLSDLSNSKELLNLQKNIETLVEINKKEDEIDDVFTRNFNIMKIDIPFVSIYPEKTDPSLPEVIDEP